MVTLTLKNYRPFADDEPLRVQIAPGFTGLVGINNAGKSTLLRFFYEFRNLWNHLQNANGVLNCVNNALTVSPLGVGDPLEVFHRRNERPITIVLDFDPPAHGASVQKAEFTILRLPPGSGGVSSTLRLFGSGVERPFRQVVLTIGEVNNQKIDMIRDTDGPATDVTPLADLARDLHSAIYIAAFRNAITEGTKDYFDLEIGTAFIKKWNAMKTGTARNQNDRAVEVEADIARIFGFASLEINAAENETTLQVRVNREPFKLRELGGGLAQFIVTYANVATRSPSFILLDEPELNLHPSLQLDFLTSLTSYASRGIFFATHSLGLARAASERLYSFRRLAERSIVRDFEQTTTLAEFVGELGFSAYKELGFTSILLVEGSTDVTTFQQFLRKLRKDHEVVILPLGGDQLARAGVDAQLSEVKRISDRVFAVVDSERSTAAAKPVERRVKFAELCTRVGINCLLTERRATENYFSENAVAAAFRGRYTAMSEFEAGPPPWGKGANWRVARELTETELAATDVGRFLARI